MTFGEKVLAFSSRLSVEFALPKGVCLLNPFSSAEAREACHQFYKLYYNDKRKRRFILGINPGRHGAGVTGIPFTDPVRLETGCAIQNAFRKKPELSSAFVYEVIGRYGGPAAFFRDYYITALFPLGFTRNGNNLNYYDDPRLLRACRDDMIRFLHEQISFGLETGPCYCLGTGKNLAVLKELNDEHGWFTGIVPLPHPRWVMQYRRKRKAEFVEMYLDAFADKGR